MKHLLLAIIIVGFQLLVSCGEKNDENNSQNNAKTIVVEDSLDILVNVDSIAASAIKMTTADAKQMLNTALWTANRAYLSVTDSIPGRGQYETEDQYRTRFNEANEKAMNLEFQALSYVIKPTNSNWNICNTVKGVEYDPDQQTVRMWAPYNTGQYRHTNKTVWGSSPLDIPVGTYIDEVFRRQRRFQGEYDILGCEHPAESVFTNRLVFPYIVETDTARIGSSVMLSYLRWTIPLHIQLDTAKKYDISNSEIQVERLFTLRIGKTFKKGFPHFVPQLIFHRVQMKSGNSVIFSHVMQWKKGDIFK